YLSSFGPVRVMQKMKSAICAPVHQRFVPFVLALGESGESISWVRSLHGLKQSALDTNGIVTESGIVLAGSSCDSAGWSHCSVGGGFLTGIATQIGVGSGIGILQLADT
ncbi:MAG: hypothetical protein ACPGQL_11270, partial [Thermoplasmatota archaeon]